MFTNARLKIKRANEHIADIERQAAIVVNPDNQIIWTDRDPNSGIQIVRYRMEEMGEIALVIGDAIHNLKTALDYAWLSTIEILVPSAISDFAKFPIYKTIKDLEDALKGRNVHVLAPRLFDLILAHIKSYKGGDFSIWAIHRLDIVDKHRLLIPMATYATIKGLELKDERGKIYPITSMGFESSGTYNIAVAPGTAINQEGRVALKIIFKEATANSLEVREGLRIFSTTVLKVVELLEKLIEG